MSADRPFAFLLTWTCYGTWLPGDARGYVSNTVLPEGGALPRENRFGTPYTGDDAYTREHARALLKHDPVYLTEIEAFVAAEAVAQAARERGWQIPRAAFMANHVHVVVQDCPEDGPAVRRVLKGTSQAALRRLTGRNQRWWTQGGSDRGKRDESAIEAAIRYVAAQHRKLVEIVNREVRSAMVAPGPPG
jgi:REP element-mobilizing transposase RayT